jgi:hypothetical protein
MTCRIIEILPGRRHVRLRAYVRRAPAVGILGRRRQTDARILLLGRVALAAIQISGPSRTVASIPAYCRDHLPAVCDREV